MRKNFATILCCFLLHHFVIAQETTSTLSGNITDANRSPIAGATVVVKHEPTGYVSTTQTNNKGLFVITNLKPGGPYTIRITYVGLVEEKFENINLTLGNNPDIDVT